MPVCLLGNPTKIAFVVLKYSGNAESGASAEALQQELERGITENRTIDTKWAVEKVTVLDDP
jgi:hypothetical protein